MLQENDEIEVARDMAHPSGKINSYNINPSVNDESFIGEVINFILAIVFALFILSILQ